MTRFPGPLSRRALEELERYVISDPFPFAIDLRRCHGMTLTTLEGDELTDWGGFFGSKLLGHNHPGLRDSEYLERLGYAANNKVPNPDFLTPECLSYYETLYHLAPESMRGKELEIYAVNSGAEAVENAMKYLINRFHEKRGDLGERGTHRFLYFDRAFHGRTLGTLHVTHLAHDPIVTKDFSEIIPGNLRLPFPHYDSSRPERENTAELERCLELVRLSLGHYQGEVVGILVEPIQGAGGHRVASPEFFRGLSQLAHDYEVFLAFDEVQTAGGQCGKVFAHDLFELPYPPEVVAVAKKFGNGALYMRVPMKDRGVLDSTWGGSLADMVRFVREIELVQHYGYWNEVQSKAKLLVAGLEELTRDFHELIFNVRGLGLYQGFSLRKASDRGVLLTQALECEQYLLLGAGAQSIRLRPPLDVTTQEIDALIAALGRVLQRMKRTTT